MVSLHLQSRSPQEGSRQEDMVRKLDRKDRNAAGAATIVGSLGHKNGGPQVAPLQNLGLSGRQTLCRGGICGRPSFWANFNKILAKKEEVTDLIFKGHKVYAASAI